MSIKFQRYLFVLFVIAFMALPAMVMAVDQPVFDSRSQLLVVPSVRVDGVPSEGVLKLYPNGTYQVIRLEKLFNCPTNGQAVFSPVNTNCGG